MKKALLIVFVLLLAGGVKAQVGGTPRELTCTEEAFTFKANIGSGWHLSMGPPETGKIVSAYAPAPAFKSIGEVPKPQSASVTNEFLTTQMPHATKGYMHSSLTLQNSDSFHFRKRYYVIPYSHDFWQVNNLSIMKSGI